MSEGDLSRAREQDSIDDEEEPSAGEDATPADEQPSSGASPDNPVRARIALDPVLAEAPRPPLGDAAPAVRPPRTRAEPARAAADPASPDRLYNLGASTKGAPLFLVAGALGMAYCAYESLVRPSLPSHFFLGFLMIGTAIAYALSFGAETIDRVAIGPRGTTLTSIDGTSVTMPRGTIERATVEKVITTTSNRGKSIVTHHVHLQKGDGGVLDLGQRRDEAAAQRLADELNEELLGPPRAAHGEAISTPMEALALLEGAREVSGTREDAEARADYRSAPSDRTLTLTWSMRPAHTSVIPAILAPLGFATALYGMHLKEVGALPLIGMGVVILIELAMLAMFAVNFGRSQVLRVGARELSVEEHRGGKCLSRKAIPLESIRAVDYSSRTDRLGGELVLRTGTTPKPALPEGEPSIEAGVQLLKDTLKYRAESERISLGRLRFGDKVRVDLALSAEIAQRTGRNEAEV